jgi:hypothetical protein
MRAAQRAPAEPLRGERRAPGNGSDGASKTSNLVAELRLRLKPPRGPPPSVEMIGAALALARGNEGALCHLPVGGSRTKAFKLRDRMIALGLIDDAGQSLLIQDTQPTKLLVRSDWIREHTPGILDLEASELRYEGTHAMRTLRARIDAFDGSESAEATVVYDLPPAVGEDAAAAKRRGDMHRRREEKCIRELDGVAGAVHRTKKAEQRHEARVVEAAVAQTVEALVDSVCQQACAWEPADDRVFPRAGDWAWLPPTDKDGTRGMLWWLLWIS